ncbi:MAG: YybH family protein [Gemmatimonadaceae bacterium]|jgi:ketosteroid isomerase-like protein
MPGRLLSGSVAATLLVTAGCISASMSNSSQSRARMVAAESALHQRSEGLQAAETALDGDKAIAFWADDAVVQPAGSPAVVGKAAILNLYHEFFATMGVKELVGTPSRLSMAQSGDLAYETGVNRIVIHTPGGDLLDMGKYLIVWKKVGGQWYVGALSFTSDAAAPTPIAGK